MEGMKVKDWTNKETKYILPLKVDIGMNDYGVYTVIIKCAGAAPPKIDEIIVYETTDLIQANKVRQAYRKRISEYLSNQSSSLLDDCVVRSVCPH